MITFVRLKGLDPPRLSAPDPKSGAATNYATAAKLSAKIGTIFKLPKFFALFFKKIAFFFNFLLFIPKNSPIFLQNTCFVESDDPFDDAVFFSFGDIIVVFKVGA